MASVDPDSPRGAALPTGAARSARRLAIGALATLLFGCTEAVAEPIFLEVGKSGSSADGGRAGRAGRGESGKGGVGGLGGGGGRSGAGGQGSVETCAPTWPEYENWRDDYARDDDEVERGLNFLVRGSGKCDGVPFDREEFDLDDDLRCWSRRRAHWEAYMATYGIAPPDLQGAINNWPQPQLMWWAIIGGSGRPGGRPPTNADNGFSGLLDDTELCEKLRSSSYRRLGIGHEGNLWVATLAKSTD